MRSRNFRFDICASVNSYLAQPCFILTYRIIGLFILTLVVEPLAVNLSLLVSEVCFDHDDRCNTHRCKCIIDINNFMQISHSH